MSRNFMELLSAQQAEGHFVCVGIDPEISKIPKRFKMATTEETLFWFCRDSVMQTREAAGAFKLNLGYFLHPASAGMNALKRVIQFIHTEAPTVPVIIDAKMGDVEHSSDAYARGLFNDLKADAVTVSPYLGGEGLQPFLARPDKGVIVLCRTSNSGSDEFQSCTVKVSEEVARNISDPITAERDPGGGFSLPLSHYVAHQVRHTWNAYGNCGLVVGGTHPKEVKTIRKIVGDDVLLLIPGIGAQQGDLTKSVIGGRNSSGKMFLISSSRDIIFDRNPMSRAAGLDTAITTIQGVHKNESEGKSPTTLGTCA